MAVVGLYKNPGIFVKGGSCCLVRPHLYRESISFIAALSVALVHVRLKFPAPVP